MKHNHNYEINYVEGKIIVTKSFLKEAGVIGSTAYTELAQVRKDYPEFTIEQRQISKKQGKKTYGSLTYKVMKEFIEVQEEENAETVLAEFERIQQLSKAHNGQYAFVKSWFLKRYSEQFVQEENAEVA